MGNERVAEWARQNVTRRIDIRPITQNRLVMGLAYAALLFIPAAFILVGIVLIILAPGKPQDALRAVGCGLVLLVPVGGILLLARYVRRGFAGYLDVNGAFGTAGLLPWHDLLYVDHLTRFADRGANVSDRKIEDNTLELVFGAGSVSIPPLIKEKELIWQLIHSIPCEHRKDGGVYRRS